MANALRYVGKRIKRLHKWEPDIATVTWAEKNVYLGSDASPLSGMMRFDETPYLEQVLNDSDRPEVWLQALCWSTQTGKTMSLLVSMAKSLDTDPTRMQFTIKNTSDVVDYIQEKVSPFLRGVKSLKTKVQELSEDAKKKTRASSINVLGGGVSFTGTTASERRSKSVKRLFMDEVSLYAKGTVVELIGRTKAYERFHRKVMLCSSLLYDGDEMSVAYADCEHKMEWNTWCSACDGYFYAGSKHLKFLTKTQWKIDSGQTEETFQLAEYRREALKDVYLECPHCSHHISNDEKANNILKKKYKFVTVEGDESGVTKGYKVNALGSRISTLETIATTWINSEAEGDQSVIAQFFVDWFNEHYVHITDSIEASQLLVLGNNLPRWEVPKDTVKIYMGVDSQKDHFWVEVKAFCYGNVSHSLWSGRVESFGDIEDIWVYGQNLQDDDGQTWMISSMGIDRRGYNENGANRTAEVDAFVEYMVSKYKNGDNDRIYATMGVSALVGDRPFTLINSRDMSSNRTKVDIKIIKISNIYMKNVVARAIERTIKKATSSEGELGYDFSANLFYINQEDIETDRAGTTSTSITRQLTSEVFDYAKNPKTGKVDQTKSWIRVHKDNHLWDTSVICQTLAEMGKVNLAIKQNGDYKDDLAALMAL